MRVVGIGASAGGLEAMANLLENLPVNTGAAFILVQHLSADHDSIMDELLAKYTHMPVMMVHEHTHLQPNTVYTIANDVSASFANGMIYAKPRKEHSKSRLPIDKFFHSLGEELKENSVGVVLSGSGTDGSRGARTIKEAGGIILAQDPKEAKFDGMPGTIIRLGLANQVLSAADVATTLDHITKRNSDLDPLSPTAVLDELPTRESFLKIIALASHNAGIDFLSYRVATLLRRTHNRMLLGKFANLSEYYDFLSNNEAELRALTDDYFIGVTRFFRDTEAFQELKEKIIPEIFAKKSPHERARIWVTACSTGEEAYSIAMLIDNYLKENKLERDFKVFASDVDQRAIHLASKGEYPSSIVADVDPDFLSTYFIQYKDHFSVKPELRDKVLFAVHDLLADPPFINLDLVTCRNFFIYLKTAAQRKVLGVFHFALNPNAYLFLGPSETIGEVKHAFGRVGRKANTYVKMPDGQFPVNVHKTTKKKNTQLVIPQPVTFIDNSPMPTDIDFNESLNPFDHYLIEQFTPTCLFINEDLDILYSQGDLEGILTLPRALARMNLYKMMDQKSALIFRNGMQKALKSDTAVVYKDVDFSKKNKSLQLTLKFTEVKLAAVPQHIVLVEILNQQEKEPSLEQVEEVVGDELLNDQLLTLEQELRIAKHRSRQLVHDLEGANEELQSSNRELMVTNEELQSTNEELQSVNEELYTVNSELQYKNDELTTISNDIRNLLRSTEIGTIFLDNDLQIRRFTPAIKRQFKLMNSDIGRSITTFNSAFNDLPLKEICQQVSETLEGFEKGVQDNQGNHYLLRILPYRTEDSVIEGLVVTFVDINDIVRAEDETFEWAGKYKAIFHFASDIIVELQQDHIVKDLNTKIAGKKRNELVGKDFTTVLSAEESKKFTDTIKAMHRTRESQNIDLAIQNTKTKKTCWFDVCCIPALEQETAKNYDATLIMSDVTEKREKERKLKQSLEEFEALVNGAKHQIALVNRKGIIKHINYTQRSGMTKEEMIGTSLYDHLPQQEVSKFVTAIENIFSNTPFEKVQFTYVSPDSKRWDVELILTPVVLEDEIRYASMIGYIPSDSDAV